METIEYKMHRGARIAFFLAGALCMILIVAIPFGVWIIARAASGKVVVSPTDVKVKALLNTNIDLRDVSRIGVVTVRVPKGIGGALARLKVGGDAAINVCVMNKSGKTKKFIASSFENYQQMMAQISKIVGMPYEEISMGAFGLKWPSEVGAKA